MTEGIEVLNQEKNQNPRRKGNLQILGNIRSGRHQTSGDFKKINKEYLRGTIEQLQTKLPSRNLIKGINTWAVALVRFSGPFFKWTREKIQQMDQRTRKLMSMHKALQPWDDDDRLMCQEKKETEHSPAFKIASLHW